MTITDIQHQAEALVSAARTAGVHLTIETRSLLPLAMGNVEMVVGVRPAQHAQQAGVADRQRIAQHTSDCLEAAKAKIAELQADAAKLRNAGLAQCERIAELEAALADRDCEISQLKCKDHNWNPRALAAQGEPVATLTDHLGTVEWHEFPTRWPTKLYAGRPPAAEQAALLSRCKTALEWCWHVSGHVQLSEDVADLLAALSAVPTHVAEQAETLKPLHIGRIRFLMAVCGLGILQGRDLPHSKIEAFARKVEHEHGIEGQPAAEQAEALPAGAWKLGDNGYALGLKSRKQIDAEAFGAELRRQFHPAAEQAEALKDAARYRWVVDHRMIRDGCTDEQIDAAIAAGVK